MHKENLEYLDKVFIRGLRIDTVIGLYDWEKQFQQPLLFDLDLFTHLDASAQSDAIGDTINYKTVSDWMIEQVQQNQYELLEPLAETLCQALLCQWPSLVAVRLTCHKPQAVNPATSVGIEILRWQSLDNSPQK